MTTKGKATEKTVSKIQEKMDGIGGLTKINKDVGKSSIADSRKSHKPEIENIIRMRVVEDGELRNPFVDVYLVGESGAILHRQGMEITDPESSDYTMDHATSDYWETELEDVFSAVVELINDTPLIVQEYKRDNDKVPEENSLDKNIGQEVGY